tara:strand:+ start:390 stop:2579 length:2190 start_codon:yes stop_codon:yes gene_type:complete
MADSIKQQIQFQLNISGNTNVARAINDISKAQIKLNKEALKDKGARAIKDLRIQLMHYGVSVKKVTGWERLRKQALDGSVTAMKLLKMETKKATEAQKGWNLFALLGIKNSRLLSNSFATFRSKLLLATFAIGLFDRALFSLVKAHARQETAERKLSAALKSTGNAVRISHKELTLMASGLQRVTKFGDEAIIEAQALMLTFTNIGKEVFPDTMEAVLNISEALGQDLQQTVIQVGKALNDPVKGMTALRRVGIQFSKEQEKQIRHFVNLNDAASAQRVILEELERQFGGMAIASRKTLAGSFAALGNAWGDMMEQMGEVLSPFMASLATSLKEITSLMKSEGERQLDFLQEIGASEETLQLARIMLLKEEAEERIKAAGAKDIDIEKSEELINIHKQQNLFLITQRDNLKDYKKTLDTSVKALMEVTGNSEAFNKALENANKHTEEAVLKGGKYAGIRSQLAKKTQTEADILAEKVIRDRENVVMTEKQIELYRLMNLAIGNYLKSLGLVADIQGEATTSTKDLIKEALLSGQLLATQFSALTSTMKSDIQERERAELDALKNTEDYKRASDKRKAKMEKDLSDKYADEKRRVWRQEQMLNISNVIMNTANAIMKAGSQLGAFAIPTQLALGAMGLYQLSIIRGQEMPAFAKGGDFITDRPMPILVGEAGRERVTITPVDRPDSMALGSMGGVTVNFTGNVLTQDFIEDEAIPMIKEAVRRGADLGVA